MPYAVTVPPPYEGIGQALRTAFVPRGDDLPCEWAELLEKLH